MTAEEAAWSGHTVRPHGACAMCEWWTHTNVHTFEVLFMSTLMVVLHTRFRYRWLQGNAAHSRRHTRAVRSPDPDASTLGSRGDHATDTTEPVCPASVAVHAPVRVSHSFTCLSRDPDASTPASCGAHATD